MLLQSNVLALPAHPIEMKRQLGAVWDAMHRIWVQVPTLPESLFISWQCNTAFIQHDGWNSPNTIRRGEFHFLNQIHTIDTTHLTWEIPNASMQWHVYLHAFAYLHLLEESEQIRWCKDWIRQNPLGKTVGSQKDALILRVTNWCKNDLRDPIIVNSLYQQAGYLFHRMALKEDGIRLLMYARALILAGTYFQGCGEANEWLKKGIEILTHETKKQILPDGVHYERNPMVHTTALEVYLDVINVLNHDQAERKIFSEAARKMANFLASIIHPDGNYALFNAAAQDGALPPRQVLDYVRRLLDYDARRQNSFTDSGFFTHQSAHVQLVINKGNIGSRTPHLSIYNDIFSYELWLLGEPIVVGSGGYGIQGAMLDYVQSAKAHNSLSIDGRDPIRTWKDKLFARRYIPHSVAFTSEYQSSHFEGVFDGYTYLMSKEISHKRMIEVQENDRVMKVRDIVTGDGNHVIESHVHLHPDVRIKKVGKGFQLQQKSMMCHLITNDDVWIEKGWYSPKTGMSEEQYVLVLRSDKLPAMLEYEIRY